MKISLPQNIIKGTLSIPKKENSYIKAKIQKLKIRGLIQYQISLYTVQQVFHKNYLEQELSDELIELFKIFNSMELYTSDYIYSYRITSKNKLLTNKRKNIETFVEILEHNKEKDIFYLLINLFPCL